MSLCKDASVSYSPLVGSSRASGMPRGYCARLIAGETWPWTFILLFPKCAKQRIATAGLPVVSSFE